MKTHLPHLDPKPFSPRGAEGGVHHGTPTEHRRGKMALGQEHHKGPALPGLGGVVREPWKNVFFTCGPSQLYPTVPDHMRAGLEEYAFSESHRSQKFMDWYSLAVDGLRQLMSIPRDYEIFFISSGTEGMERVIQNCVEKTSGHCINGSFSQRWQITSQQLGHKTEVLQVAAGQALDLSKAKFPKDTELICVTQNETSTGAMVDPQDIAALGKRYPRTLIGVDIVSSAPVVELDFKTVDCVIFSVQKGFGLPAGLGIMVVSPRAIAKNAVLSQKMSTGSYHSFDELKKHAAKNQTIDTPNILGIYLLGRVTRDFNTIGIDRLRAQTKTRAEKLYQFITNHPVYSPFVQDRRAQSLTTATVEVRGGSGRVIQALETQGLIVSSGYKELAERQIRIANFPAHSDDDFERLLVAMDKTA